MINFTIAIRFRIAVIAAVLSLSTLGAEACSCASAGPGGCQVPVADIIVRATVVSKEGEPTSPSVCRTGVQRGWATYDRAAGRGHPAARALGAREGHIER